MTAALVLTAAGRAAVADNANVGMNAIQLRELGIGSGTKPDGADDDARTTLRNSRDTHAVRGSDATAGHIAFRSDFMPGGNYSVTEVGVFARVGADGQQFLFAYWAAGSAADAVAAAATGTTLVVAGVIAITSSAADIDVTPALNVAVGGVTPPDASLEAKGLAEFATVAEHRTGTSEALAATPKGAAALISDLLGSATAHENTLGKLGDLILALDGSLTAALARIATLEGRPVGNETLLYESAAGIDVTLRAVIATTANVTNYDAIKILFADANGTAGSLWSTHPALVSALGQTVGTRRQMPAEEWQNAGRLLQVFRASAASLDIQGGAANYRVHAIIGIDYDTP